MGGMEGENSVFSLMSQTKISVLGLCSVFSFSPYQKSALWRWPLWYSWNWVNSGTVLSLSFPFMILNNLNQIIIIMKSCHPCYKVISWSFQKLLIYGAQKATLNLILFHRKIINKIFLKDFSVRFFLLVIVM